MSVAWPRFPQLALTLLLPTLILATSCQDSPLQEDSSPDEATPPDGSVLPEHDAGPPDADSPEDTTPSSNSTCMRRANGNLWVDIATVPAEIDYAHSIGVDCYDMWMTKSGIDSIRSGGTDHIANAISHAHSQRMKLDIRIRADDYTGGDPEALRADPSPFYSVFRWLLQTYPQLDGVELEEPVSPLGFGAPESSINAWLSFNNSFFTALKDIVAQYHSLTDGSFTWSFNCPSNSEGGVRVNGIDVAYIRDHSLFNTYTIQNTGGGTLPDYQSTYNTWKSRFPNFTILSGVYLTYSRIYNDPPCSNSGTIPECWNQACFDQLRWTHGQGIPTSTFTLMRFKTSRSMWPGDDTPGDTAGDKARDIWSQ